MVGRGEGGPSRKKKKGCVFRKNLMAVPAGSHAQNGLTRNSFHPQGKGARFLERQKATKSHKLGKKSVTKGPKTCRRGGSDLHRRSDLKKTKGRRDVVLRGGEAQIKPCDNIGGEADKQQLQGGGECSCRGGKKGPYDGRLIGMRAGVLSGILL